MCKGGKVHERSIAVCGPGEVNKYNEGTWNTRQKQRQDVKVQTRDREEESGR